MSHRNQADLSKSILVSRLKNEISDEQLASGFSKYGEIKRIEQSRGFATIEFEQLDNVNSVVKEKKSLAGQIIRVSDFTPDPPSWPNVEDNQQAQNGMEIIKLAIILSYIAFL